MVRSSKNAFNVWATIRNFFLLVENLFFQRIRVNLLHLFLESSVNRLNQQSSRVMIIFFIHHLISSHPRV